MENFEAYNPTKIIFGKDVVDQIDKELEWKRAVILIGKGSVKKNGLYARIISILNMAGLEHVTVEGIRSNPVYQDADHAVQVAKRFNAEAVIAIGGGSVMDTAKAVSIGYFVEHSVWDFYLHKAVPKKALPMINILTLAACGTEMNRFSVLQDTQSGIKTGFGSPLLYPTVSFLDPSFTVTVPPDWTSYGISNLVAHCLEQYFGKGDSPLSDCYAVSVIKLAMEYGRKVITDPFDYNTRANIMWLSVNALNGSLTAGKSTGDWGCHAMERSLAVLYDIQHGAGLSIIYPAWLKYNLCKIQDKLSFLAKEVFGINNADPSKASEGFIVHLQQFFNEINTPTRLSDVNIYPGEKQRILENFKINAVSGDVYKLTEPDLDAILDQMW